jgi:hypothetical protein
VGVLYASTSPPKERCAVSNDKIIKQISWRRLDGNNQSPKFVLGVTFNDGIEVIANPTDRQPATAAA